MMAPLYLTFTQLKIILTTKKFCIFKFLIFCISHYIRQTCPRQVFEVQSALKEAGASKSVFQGNDTVKSPQWHLNEY